MTTVAIPVPSLFVHTMRLSTLFTLIVTFASVQASPVERRAPHTGHCLTPTSSALQKEHSFLLASKLIPDIYDDFEPSTTVTVYYHGDFVRYNASQGALDTISAPSVYFPTPAGDGDDTTYTLIMNDPDALGGALGPSFLHWIRRGLKTSCDTPATDGGQDVRVYIPPTPPPLLPPTAHRYALTILREPKGGYAPDVLENLLKLASFDLRTYQEETGAKIIGSTYFLGSLTT